MNEILQQLLFQLFQYFAKDKKIAITKLCNAIEKQSLCHLVVTIFPVLRYLVTGNVLKSAKLAITRYSRVYKLIRTQQEMCVKHKLTHPHIHTQTACHNLPSQGYRPVEDKNKSHIWLDLCLLWGPIAIFNLKTHLWATFDKRYFGNISKIGHNHQYLILLLEKLQRNLMAILCIAFVP